MTSSFDLRSHRPEIEPGQLEDLRRRLFGGVRRWPEIPGYEIEAELGKGAFGRVYRAFDPRFQRQVALKVMPVDSPEARLRIEREAQALARLSHPNVVQVYDKGPAGEHGYFLALEYVDGPDLQRWLAEQPRSLPQVLAKLLEIAEGLAAAHRAGLVHRDLKPANVLVGTDGRTRVLDFGLARALDDASTTGNEELLGRQPTASRWGHVEDHPWSCDEASLSVSDRPTVAHVVQGQPDVAPGGDHDCAGPAQLARPLTAPGRFVGTPSYAAPEQHLGLADARSDQFSFCVVLFEAVYGRRPLPLRRGVSPGAQLRTEAIDFRPGERRVPGWLVALLRQGLALDPRRRHASMDVVARELRSRVAPRAARVHGGWLAVGAAVLTACAMLFSGLRDDEVEACREARDALPPAWVAHRSTVDPELPELGAELQTYAEHWRTGRQNACNEPDLVRRAEIDACLDAGAVGLGRLARQLGTASPAVWQDLRTHPGPRPLAGLVETLPDPTRCLTDTEPRATPRARETWDHLLAARMGLANGELAEASQQAELALALARTHNDRPRLVVAEYLQVLLDVRRGEPRDLADVLLLVVEALEVGERSLAADIAASSLTLRTMGTMSAGSSRSTSISTELLGRLTKELAALRSDAAFDPREAPAVAAWLRFAEGHARLALGDAARAQTLYHEAAALLREASPEVPLHLVAVAELNEAHAMSARFPVPPEVASLAAHALDVRRAALGPEHPLVAHETRALGEILVRLGDLDGALRRYAEADALFTALDLPLERVFLRAELAHVQGLAARRARKQLQQAKDDGSDPGSYRAEFEQRRQLALRETLELERLAEPLLVQTTADPRARGPEQARVWAVAMANYGLHRGCWERTLAAGRQLEAVCEHLEGSEPSCMAGQRQRQAMLEQGAAARASDEGCPPRADLPLTKLSAQDFSVKKVGAEAPK